ncbi:MAG: class I SAM-dependent methyltransferase [Candidatus Dormibacterales bacterium]
MGSKELFPAVFSRHAGAYARRHDAIWRRGGDAARRRLLEALGAGPGDRVADLGCGPGDLGARLRPTVGRAGLIVGVDLAPGMLAVARKRSPAALLLRGDLERLPFKDACLDGAVSGHAFQFVPDLGAALREAARVLRPGGRLAASVPAGGEVGPGARLDAVFDALLPPAPSPTDRGPTLTTLADAGAWREAVLEAGFASAAVEVVESSETYAGAAEMVSQAAGWWSCAVRLEAVPRTHRAGLVERAARELERLLGAGPVSVARRAHVLVADL